MIRALERHFYRRWEAKSLSLPGGPYPGADAEAASALEAFVAQLDDLDAVAQLAESATDGAYGYLAAVSAIRAEDFDRAADWLRRANRQPTVRFAVPDNPIATSSGALQPLGELRRWVPVGLEKDPSLASEFLKAGFRIARAEPICRIHILLGAAMVKKVWQTRPDAVPRDLLRWCGRALDANVGRIGSTRDAWHFSAIGLTESDLALYASGELPEPKRSVLLNYLDLCYRREIREATPLLPPEEVSIFRKEA